MADWNDRYIAIEVNEGRGNDVQAVGLCLMFAKAEIPFLLIHEPGGALIASEEGMVGDWHHKAEQIRDKIKGAEGQRATADEISQLFYESRDTTLGPVEELLREREGAVVVSVRSFMSSWAIQRGHDGLSFEALARRQRQFVGSRVPGLGLYLNVPLAELKKRLEGRGGLNWQDEQYNLGEISSAYKRILPFTNCWEKVFNV
ncbi:hypothetical protein MUP65_02055, partial [Patescibacteria group bacterium]|nr:hypothetical protein [Patescibacteria group bacterium]